MIRATIADSVHSGPELLGVALSPVFLVMLGVWLQGLRKKNRRPFDVRLLITSAGICLLSIMSMSNARRAETATAPELAHRVAASMDEQSRAAMEKFLQGMAAINNDHAETSSGLNPPVMDELYTPASYATPEVASAIVTTLRQQGEANERYNAAIEDLWTRTIAEVEAAHWPAREKADVLEGFVKGRANSTAERVKYFAANRALRQAAIDLYQFALEHQDSIDDGAVRRAFNQKKNAVDRLRAAFETVRAEYLQYQERLKKEAAEI